MSVSQAGNCIDPTILEQFINLIPVPIAQYDAELRFSFCNQAFCDLTGIPRESLITMRIGDLRVLKLEGDGVQTAIAEKRQGKARIEIALQTGTKILHAHTIPIIDDTGAVTAVFGVYLDITSEELEKKKTSQIILDNPIPFLTLGTDLRLTGSNQAFVELSGYSSDQLARMALADFSILSMKGDSARVVMQKKRPVKSETELDFPSGKKILNLHSIPLLNATGDVDQILITCVDITESKRLFTYLVAEISRLSKNLSSLAKGDLTFDLTVGESDQYTREAERHFTRIQQDLKEAHTALVGVIGEITSLSTAIRMGDLKARGNPDQYTGTFAEIINGLNSVMQAVETPIDAAITLSGEYASGNFGAVPPHVKVEGDFLVLKEALINIGIEVSQTLRGIDREMEELSQRAEEATSGVRDIADGSKIFARNANTLSVQSEQGKENLDQVLRAMMDLSTNVEEVASSTESVSRATHETNELSKHGVDLAHKAEDGMKGIMVSTGDVDRIISEIKSEMQKIGKIVRVITDIASQTNLLALNAAIEAARAGEAGRGFAVVASEVKSLALESRASAENIAEMIGNLQNKSDQAADAMSQAEHAVNQGNAAVLETLEVFNRIVESVEKIAKNMDDVSATTEEQAASVEEITASSHEVNVLVEEIAKDAISSAAAAEQSASGTSQIAAVVEDLNQIIMKVSSEIGKFKYS
ncbi:MAG TPA: methyl-accepting chemotaxis protein [Methanospirillum sp.]|nr:methyl-accepting chemotaxis protein [Methanospirillum sp.]